MNQVLLLSEVHMVLVKHSTKTSNVEIGIIYVVEEPFATNTRKRLVHHHVSVYYFGELKSLSCL
jgi:hypothetical protein